MKKSKEITNIHNEIEASIENTADLIKAYHKKVKKEYSVILSEEKNKLLEKISENENLDLNMLKNKYLKPKELANVSNTPINILDQSEELLDKTIVNGIIYYYENKEKGKVYNESYNEVGTFKNNVITLN